MLFYLKVLSLLTAVILLIYRSIYKFDSFIPFNLQVNAVIFLLNCLGLISCFNTFFIILSVISPASVLKDSSPLCYFSWCPTVFQYMFSYNHKGYEKKKKKKIY